jgi:hypothetical protein
MKPCSVLLLFSTVPLFAISTSFAGEQAMPANHPKIDLPAQSATHQTSDTIAGTVLETMNSGGYSYVYLQKNGGERLWVAVPETRVAVGEQMRCREGLVMTNFESKTLKRRFDRIVFSNGVIPPIAPVRPPAAKTAAQPSANAPKDLSVPLMEPKRRDAKLVIGSGPAVLNKRKSSVARAKGADAYTVEEIYRKSAQLNKRHVVVRGKVVKASTGIMKRTWIHIQDGSGSQAKGTHNLVCTTRDTANVGDVVIVSGTLAKDKDFGYGYRYKVIVEDAVISK